MFELNAMPFGWSMSPLWSTKLGKPIRAWLNDRQIPHLWYVDDVLILGASKSDAEMRASTLIHKLTDLGVQVNVEKSMPEAAQKVRYLGHDLDLRENLAHTPLEKSTPALKSVQHQLSGKRCQPRNLAAIAGNLLDLNKSNARLHGLPQQLMKHAARGVAANKQKIPTAHVSRLWGLTCPLTWAARECLEKIREGLKDHVPRVLRPEKLDEWVLQTENSD